jgi:hypothetical protein
MSAVKIQLTFTDDPRPPQPPANDDLEAPREAEEGGLRAIGRRMSGALRSVLEGPPVRERTPPAANPPAAPLDNAQVPDDD